METVDGRKTKAICLSKKSATIFICCGLTNLNKRSKNSSIKAITFPGKGKGSMTEIRSPIQHSKNIRIICLKNFKTNTPEKDIIK